MRLCSTFEQVIYCCISLKPWWCLSDKQNISTAQAANKIADEFANISHPIWGHRSWKIIQSLIENKWHTQERLSDAH
jgi:hypothetical protein